MISRLGEWAVNLPPLKVTVPCMLASALFVSLLSGGGLIGWVLALIFGPMLGGAVATEVHKRSQKAARKQRRPQIFEWVPMPGQLFRWMFCGILAVGLLIALAGGLGWGISAGLLIGAPVGMLACYLYNLATKDFINKEGVDELQRQIHSIRRWLDHRGGKK